MKIYLDTSVISALFDKRNPERKALTEDFFSDISKYKVYISEITIAEINRTPDRDLTKEMKRAVSEFPIISLENEMERLAEDYILHGAIPQGYSEDAYHIAVAVIYELDYLLSWNFRHIVRNKTRDIVRMLNTMKNLKQIEIISPGELL